jgi:transposase
MSKASPSQEPDWREIRRLRAWELKQQGWKQRDIAEAFGVTPGAVSQWLKRAEEGGKEALCHRPPPGPRPRLTEQQRAQLPALVAQGAKRYGYLNNAWTIERVAEAIQQEFDVTYHPAHLGRLLRELEISIKAPKWQPKRGWLERKAFLFRRRRRNNGTPRPKRRQVTRLSAREVNASGR